MGSCCSKEAAPTRAGEPTSPATPAGNFHKNIRVMICTWNVGDAPPGNLEPLFAHAHAAPRAADIIVIAAQEARYKIPGEEAGADADEAMLRDTDDDDDESQQKPSAANTDARGNEGHSSPATGDKLSASPGGPKRGASFSNSPNPSSNLSAVSSAAVERTGKLGNHWLDHVTKCLPPGYAVVGRKGLWSMRLLVFVREEMLAHVSEVVESREATGIGSVAGNKGGVAIGMLFRGTRLLFVGSHLAAHLEHVAQRNSDYHEIVEGLAAADSGFGKQLGVEPLNLYNHVFWCGDLNYRIDDEAKNVIDLANKGEAPAKLLEKDQLVKEMAKGNVFKGFEEAGKVTFTPTYRFLRNTTGEQREFDPWKNRVPSWCDRILHKGLGPADWARCVKYDAEHAVRTSDHSPVFALYDLPARGHMFDKLNDKEGGKYTLKFSKLSCKELLNADVGGLSDPFIIFTMLSMLPAGATDATKVGVKTRTVDDNLNPSWDKPDDAWEFALPGRHSLDELRLRYVHALVYDEDVVTNDTLGQAVLPLVDVIAAGENGGAEKKLELEVPVMQFGKQYGSLKCTVELVETK